MSGLRPPHVIPTGVPGADSTTRQLAEAVRGLQDSPASSIRLISSVELADGVDTAVPHKLGRLPVFVRESTPRSKTTTALGSTGRVQEIRGDKWDRTKLVVLRATGWGATIVVDVEVM